MTVRRTTCGMMVPGMTDDSQQAMLFRMYPGLPVRMDWHPEHVVPVIVADTIAQKVDT
jgi:hypothetical protein